MRQIMRLVLAMVGLFNAVLGLGFLLLPERLAKSFFIAPVGVQGMATIRADFPAFFLMAAGFTLYAVWTTRRAPLLVPIGLLAIALLGRVLSIATDGVGPMTAPPMIAEAVMIGALGLGYRVFGAAR